MEESAKRTEQAAGYLWGPVSEVVLALPPAEKAGVEEIRLRMGQPLAVFGGGRLRYVTEAGTLSVRPEDGLRVTRSHLEECFRKLCGYAVHTHEEEISQGFISVPGGHRAGLGGTAFVRANRTAGLRDITSINLRIARQVRGSAAPLVPLVLAGEGGLLLAGPPGSGKTTLLRDLARQLSEAGKKVAVVDERCELSGICGQTIENDLGPGCDVLAGGNKGESILMAVRCLSPQYIICDEVGRPEEIEAVCAGLCSGAVMITSIHAGSFDQLGQRPQFLPLARSGAFAWVAFVGGPGQPPQLRRVDQL